MSVTLYASLLFLLVPSRMSDTTQHKTFKNKVRNYYDYIKKMFTRKNTKWSAPNIPSHSKTMFSENIHKDDDMVNFKLGTSWIYESQKGRYYKKKNLLRNAYGNGSAKLKKLVKQKNTIHHYKAHLIPGLNRALKDRHVWFIDREKYKKEINELRKKHFVFDLTKYQEALSGEDEDKKAAALEELAVLKAIIRDAYRLRSDELIHRYKNLEWVARIAMTLGIVTAVSAMIPSFVALNAHAAEAANNAVDSLQTISKLKFTNELAKHTLNITKERAAEAVERMHQLLEFGGEKVVEDFISKLEEDKKIKNKKYITKGIEEAGIELKSIQKSKEIVKEYTFEQFQAKQKVVHLQNKRYGSKKFIGVKATPEILLKITPLILLIIAAIVNPIGNVVIGIGITTNVIKLGAEAAAHHYENKVEELEMNTERLSEDIDHMIENNGKLFHREYNPLFEKTRAIKDKINSLLNNPNIKSESNLLSEFALNKKEENAKALLNLMIDNVRKSNHNKYIEDEHEKLRRMENYNNSNIAVLQKRNEKIKTFAQNRMTRRNRSNNQRENSIELNLSSLVKNLNKTMAPRTPNSLASPTFSNRNVPQSPAFSAPSASLPDDPNLNNE